MCPPPTQNYTDMIVVNNFVFMNMIIYTPFEVLNVPYKPEG